MAIIKPSKSFAGSALSNASDAGKYIKPDIRQVLFNKNNNKEGTHLYFLPPYKQDVEGNGVWYKVIRVRDNFGDKFKDKYVVVHPDDPVAHFERNFKAYYPEESKPVDEAGKDGRMMKRYPFFGRVTTRVLFNVALVNDLAAGAHILDLPSFNGASLLTNWLNTKDSRGRERAMLNDATRCIPVFVKLNDGGGAPWQIEPDATEPAELPTQLADSDYLYNLDEVFTIKSKEELLGKLQTMYRPDVFEQCMAGYGDFKAPKTTIAVGSNPTANAVVAKPVETAPAKAKAAPALANIPKATIKKSELPTPAVPDAEMPAGSGEPEFTDESNPLAGVDREAAMRFLNSNS